MRTHTRTAHAVRLSFFCTLAYCTLDMRIDQERALMTLSSVLSFKEQALAFVTEHIAFATPIVFALGFAESIVLLSLFVPSSILLLAIGGLHSAAGGSFWPLWLAGSLGAFLGDLVSYALGRFFKEEIGGVWPLKNNPEWYVLARTYVQRWGMLGVIVSKFLGMMRPFVPIVAGAMDMRWPLFLVASFVSALIWAGAFLSPGYGVSLLLR